MRNLLMVAMLVIASPALAEEAKETPMPGSPAAAEPLQAAKCVIDLDQDFIEYDQNLDGKITLQEMYDQPGYAETEAQKAELKDTRYQMFYGMDANGDGQVNKDELRQYEIKHLPNCVIK